MDIPVEEMVATLVPKAGLVVRDPYTKQPLPPEGREVGLTEYWRRRLADGDVSRKQAATKPKQR